ncbi:MAG: efflux RND transporter permease subunit, partial [Verrucomicrobia bacterium]|nr:efflux RND transporter permease subunit [Verrucomicrobiota bacterium]
KQTTREEVAGFALNEGFDAYLAGTLNQEPWKQYLRGTPRDNWPEWITLSKVTVVPFYDRTGLIYETLGTLNESITEEILVTIIVVLVMVMHLRSGFIISAMLPLAVLLCFISMKFFGVQANIVALSGIVIAIGTIVDMGIVICENILRHLELADPSESKLEVVHRAASEVGSAVLTAVATTVISFLPVFTMIGAEGKLFKPLAFTKSFALVASIIIALTVLPMLAYTFFHKKQPGRTPKKPGHKGVSTLKKYLPISLVILLVGLLLTTYWEPLGPEKGMSRNLIFVTVLIGGLLGFFKFFQHFYVPMLRWCLSHKAMFLSIPLSLMLIGGMAWQGFPKLSNWMPGWAKGSPPVQYLAHKFPGLGKEFMPNLDEGSFLYMPTTMTHASIGESIDIIQKQDIAIQSIPEIDSVVGKLGRAETPLDPAPVSMIETIINYKPEYKIGRDGRRTNYKYENGEFVRDVNGELIEDRRGRPFRQWRDEIRTPNDIWKEIVKAAKIPGTTSAPKLQPIAARIVMLASGMRAPMGVKVKGPDLDTIEKVGLQIEQYLKEVPSVEPSAVIADRIVGKPYLEIVPDRESLARYGIPIRKFQDVVEIAIGGRKVTGTVEGRERFPVRVRYSRELRDSIETLDKILVPGKGGLQIPITELAEIKYVRGPQVIKSEDTFLVGYVVFDKKPDFAEVDVMEQCQAYLQSKIDSGEFSLPRGVSYRFAGSYENQLRATKTLAVVLPVALFAIFMILYFEFKSVSTTLLVFSGIFVAWSGGFLMLWLYGQPWFLDFSVFGVDMRNLFQVHTINLSVAVWVGFLALFGIATDDGVIISTYISQIMREHKPGTVQEVREAIVLAGSRRVRPCLMTVATTILALIPVLTSTGRGSDVMVPMAIPSFGGMTVVVITIFVVPVLYSIVQEGKVKKAERRNAK